MNRWVDLWMKGIKPGLKDWPKKIVLIDYYIYWKFTPFNKNWLENIDIPYFTVKLKLSLKTNISNLNQS
jgi:hypothetical protein